MIIDGYIILKKSFFMPDDVSSQNLSDQQDNQTPVQDDQTNVIVISIWNLFILKTFSKEDQMQRHDYA